MKWPASFPKIPALLPAILLALLVSWSALSISNQMLRSNYRELIQTQVQRDADLLTDIALSGEYAGAVASLGLAHPTIKAALKNEVPGDDPQLLAALQSIQDAFRATAVYLALPDGTVSSSVVSIGANLFGDQIHFRPYFQRALRGEKNFYVAVGTTTGLRSIYYAAPVYETTSQQSAVIGVVTMRLADDALQRIITRYEHHPVLLLSPQNIVFSSNYKEWFGHMAHQPTATEIASIQQLQQFGKRFQDNRIQVLPFDWTQPKVSFDGLDYWVHNATINWNDPNGEWKLVLLAKNQRLMPLHFQWAIGLGAGLMALGLCWLIMRLRQRAVEAKALRMKAEKELQVQTRRLETESEVKSFLTELSIELQQTENYTDFAQRLLTHLTPRMAASYAAVYVYQPRQHAFIPVGGFGIPVTALHPFALEQGLLGQISNHAQTIMLDDPNELPIRVQSGLGSNPPQAVLLVPIHHLNKRLGLIVIASMKPFQTAHLTLQEALKPILATQLSVMEKTQPAE